MTLNSHLVFVKVDERREAPAGAAGHRAARARRRRRFTPPRSSAGGTGGRASSGGPSAGARGADDDGADGLRWRFESSRSVLPEDTLFGNTMFPGKLLMDIDEAGGILSMRYCRGLVMTACLDALDFYAPISTHEVVTFKAGLNHVGSSSLEVGVKVLTEVPIDGRDAARVHGVPHLRAPRRRPPAAAVSRPSRRRRRPSSDAGREAVERRARRLERVRRLKASLIGMSGQGGPAAADHPGR